jgi:hypothetical protein
MVARVMETLMRDILRSFQRTGAKLLLAAAPLVSAHSAHAAQTWNFADAVTNSGGVLTLAPPWSLHWRNTPGCAPGAENPVNMAFSMGGAGLPLGGWKTGSNAATLAKNFSATTYVHPDGMTVAPNQVVVWPGANGECLIVRFTVPANQPPGAGYTVNGNFKGAYPPSPGAPGVKTGDGVVLKAFQSGWSIPQVGSTTYTSPAYPQGSTPFNGVNLKNPGGTLEFAVAMRQNAAFDATLMALTISGPDPIPQAAPVIPLLRCVDLRAPETVVDLSTGKPFWTVTNPGSSISVNPAAASNAAWAPVNGAQWIGPTFDQTRSGVFRYQAKVEIERCEKGRPPRLIVAYQADNSANLLINGQVVQSQAGSSGMGFVPASLTSYTKTYNAGLSGVHTITFDVNNSEGNTGLSARVIVAR